MFRGNTGSRPNNRAVPRDDAIRDQRVPALGGVAQQRHRPVLFQSAAMGALAMLRAATDLLVRGCQCYGPSHVAEQRGYPRLVQSSAASHDERLQRWLKYPAARPVDGRE